MKREKLPALLLTAALLLSLSPAAAAAGFTDTAGHWAEASIGRWSACGVVEGENGLFRPDDPMTRAEAAAVFARLLGLGERADLSGFPDFDENGWYAEALSRAAAKGIVSGVVTAAGTELQPGAPVSRQAFLTMLARALGLKPEAENRSGLGNEADAWAAGYVNALLNRGYLRDRGGSLNARADMTRAAAMRLLDQTIAAYAGTDGQTVEGGADGSVRLMAAGRGVTLIRAKNVTLRGQFGDVLISDGARGGLVLLKDARVEGCMTVDAPADVELSGESNVSALRLTGSAENAGVSVGAESSITEIATEAAGSAVSGAGEVGAVNGSGNGADISVTTANTRVSVSTAAENADGSVTTATVSTVNDENGRATDVTTTVRTETVTENADGSVTTTAESASTTVDPSGAAVAAAVCAATETRVTNADGSVTTAAESRTVKTAADGSVTTTETRAAVMVSIAENGDLTRVYSGSTTVTETDTSGAMATKTVETNYTTTETRNAGGGITVTVEGTVTTTETDANGVTTTTSETISATPPADAGGSAAPAAETVPAAARGNDAPSAAGPGRDDGGGDDGDAAAPSPSPSPAPVPPAAGAEDGPEGENAGDGGEKAQEGGSEGGQGTEEEKPAPVYTLTYDLLGGAWDIEPAPVEAASVTLPETRPELADAFFLGWAELRSEGVRVYQPGDDYDFGDAAEAALSAMWLRITFEDDLEEEDCALDDLDLQAWEETGALLQIDARVTALPAFAFKEVGLILPLLSGEAAHTDDFEDASITCGDTYFEIALDGAMVTEISSFCFNVEIADEEQTIFHYLITLDFFKK